jgi:hypothetical protein
MGALLRQLRSPVPEQPSRQFLNHLKKQDNVTFCRSVMGLATAFFAEPWAARWGVPCRLRSGFGDGSGIGAALARRRTASMAGFRPFFEIIGFLQSPSGAFTIIPAEFAGFPRQALPGGG